MCLMLRKPIDFLLRDLTCAVSVAEVQRRRGDLQTGGITEESVVLEEQQPLRHTQLAAVTLRTEAAYAPTVHAPLKV